MKCFRHLPAPVALQLMCFSQLAALRSKWSAFFFLDLSEARILFITTFICVMEEAVKTE